MGAAISLLLALFLTTASPATDAAAHDDVAENPHQTLALHAFYNARYDDAAAHAMAWRAEEPLALASYEVRTSALLFDVKRRLGDDTAKRRPLADCGECAELLTAFDEDFAEGQRLARDRIAQDPDDESAHFYLARLGLNYLWLQNGPLGRRTGWREYREARRAIERTLEQDPDHLRGRVALAWIDYIVDTRMPWGTKWLFGGGSRTRAVAAMRAASESQGPYYDVVEARFGLWEMLVREGDVAAAVEVARELAYDFPGNEALAEFVSSQAPNADLARGAR